MLKRIKKTIDNYFGKNLKKEESFECIWHKTCKDSIYVGYRKCDGKNQDCSKYYSNKDEENFVKGYGAI